MDKKRMMMAMALSVVVVIGWSAFLQWQYASHPQWKRPDAAATNPATNPATGPATMALADPATAASPASGAVVVAPSGVGSSATTVNVEATTTPAFVQASAQAATQAATQAVAQAATQGTTQPAAGSPANPGAQPTQPGGPAAPSLGVVTAASVPSPLALGSTVVEDKTYSLALALSGQGGGIDSITLNRFKDPQDTAELYKFQQPYPGADDTRPLATRWVTINGWWVDMTDAVWQLEPGRTGATATYRVELGDKANPSAPMIRLRKTYQVLERGDKEGRDGYELLVTTSVDNLTSGPVAVKTGFNGATMPPRELDRGGERMVLVGYNKEGNVELERFAVESFVKDKLTQEISRHKNNLPMLWAGSASAYFNAVVQPEPPTGAAPPRVAKASAASRNPDETDADKRNVAVVFESADLPIAAGASAVIPVHVYAGPRERDLLKNDYYGAWPRNYKETLSTGAGPCSVCTFSWLIDVLVGMLRGFHFVLRDWGLAIIVLVVIVRVLLHPITKKSQVSMSKMGKMQPEIERLKKKFGDNKEELNKAMMTVYKEQGFTPVLGCLPMFLQMPIWIALYNSLQTSIELRQAPFLWGATWIHNLARPDRLFTFNHPISLYFFSVASINLLPLLLAVVFFLQQKYQPKPPASTPEQAQQQKMMQWMSLLFPVFLYNGPSGLNLYILTSTTIGIIESKRIRDHIKERDEAAKAGRVLVDAKPTRAGRRLAEDARRESQEPVKEGWLARLQRKAEEMKGRAEEIREQERKGKKRRP